MKKIILISSLMASALFLFSCASSYTKPVAKPSNQPPARPDVVKPSQSDLIVPEEEENIDLVGLQTYLKLVRPIQKLGYTERKFNTCEVGFGYSPTNNCRPKTFVVIHFQLMCRDSEGTVTKAITQADLTPISRQVLLWTLKKAKGELLTDNDGYGQIQLVSNDSQRMERLKINLRSDFLFLKAGELTQMITPKSWCE